MTFRLHDDAGFGDGGAYRLVRQDDTSVDVDLILDDHILAQHCHVLHPDLTEPRGGGGSEARVSTDQFGIDQLMKMIGIYERWDLRPRLNDAHSLV